MLGSCGGGTRLKVAGLEAQTHAVNCGKLLAASFRRVSQLERVRSHAISLAPLTSHHTPVVPFVIDLATGVIVLTSLTRFLNP